MNMLLYIFILYQKCLAEKILMVRLKIFSLREQFSIETMN